MADTYTTSVTLKHNQKPAYEDMETGEYKTLTRRPANIPVGMQKLKYKSFSILNGNFIPKVGHFFSNEELGVIFHMISIADFNTNSMKPLCDDLSIRDKAVYLNIKKDKVKVITDKLFKMGVYLSIKVYENEEKEYWVLNPNISWKGRLVQDSIFLHFQETAISKLLS